MEKLEYIIEDSTIAEVLGVQNFTNEESAILELVKNAYDAQAKSVLIDISGDSIVIKDDGCGMNRARVLQAWMHIGKSDKDYLIGEGENTRVLAGSKGVGRFAIARLGRAACVYTKTRRDTAVLWKTDWNTNALQEYAEKKTPGTTIVIEKLRDNWTASRVRNLEEFLSRTYNDDKMKIHIQYKGVITRIARYFKEFRLGVNCVSLIKLNYHADTQKLICNIDSDEFKDDAAGVCPNIDLKKQVIEIDVAEELATMRQGISEEASDEVWRELLASVGDFVAELYFSLKNTNKVDANKFFYKHTVLDDRYDAGVILYRNAFSISSYEGKKDWLGFGKRSRISPAAATHPTGAWRVRENQMAGKVIIDKRENSNLSDLMNRQGLVENDVYDLFVAIIVSGINCFERYRQAIIRSIVKNTEVKEKKETSITDKVMKNPQKLEKLSSDERGQLFKELKDLKKVQAESERQVEETEERYRYDIRLLNLLATSGLKATSIAHEMHNRRNSTAENVDNIIEALKCYELWDIVNEPDHRRYIYQDVPALLEKNRKINQKIISFMDTMLSKSEKEQFIPEDICISEFLEEIKNVWRQEYQWVDIVVDAEAGLHYRSAKDIISVILDNLILNSIQQNEERVPLQISIQARKTGTGLSFVYIDAGKGLAPKYKGDPFRILEVHETSRENGHGIGMWIVNNTIINTGGEVRSIKGDNGFRFEFTIGERV